VTVASQWNIRTGLKYEWQPDKECGQWDPFEPAFFCKVMKRLGGPLLMAGDSLTRLMQESLHNLQQIRDSRKRFFLYTPHVCKQWEASDLMVSSRALCRAVALCGPTLPVLRARKRPPHARRESALDKLLRTHSRGRARRRVLPALAHSHQNVGKPKAVLLYRGAD